MSAENRWLKRPGEGGELASAGACPRGSPSRSQIPMERRRLSIIFHLLLFRSTEYLLEMGYAVKLACVIVTSVLFFFFLPRIALRVFCFYLI